MSKTPSYLAMKVSFRVAREYKNVYLICIFFWSLLGVEKSLGHAQIGLLYGFNSKFPTRIPTPFICGVPPGLKHTSCSMRGSRIKNMHEARDKRSARAGPTTSPPFLFPP